MDRRPNNPLRKKTVFIAVDKNNVAYKTILRKLNYYNM